MPNHRVLFSIAALLGPLAVAAQAAAAQPASAGPPAAAPRSPGSPTPQLIETPGERADELYLKAKPLFDTQRWTEALPLLEEAYRLKPSYDIATSYGAVLLALGRPREAAEALSVARAIAPSDLDGASRARLTSYETRARAQIAVVRVQVGERGATVLVDGKAVGTSPTGGELFLDAGEHRFEADKDGARSAPVVRVLGKGSIDVVVLGALGEGGGSGSGRGGGAEPWVLAVGYGGAAAAVVGAVVFTALANARASDAEAELAALQSSPSAPCCDELRDLRQEQQIFANAALWSFVGSGALAAGTTVYVLVAGAGGSRGASLGPRWWVGGHGAGLGLNGRW
ncbi:MAG: tetratricopeptide repeat protein [Deltaproteobacteria bacterium]|nr:tetratricopeptide repeat protein [Deltaproteobacteria bacterium]